MAQGRFEDDSTDRRASKRFSKIRGRSKTRSNSITASAPSTPKGSRKSKSRKNKYQELQNGPVVTHVSQWPQHTDAPRALSRQDQIAFLDETEDDFDDRRHGQQTFVGERKPWSPAARRSQRSNSSAPFISRQKRDQAYSSVRTAPRITQNASKKVLRVKRAALFFLAGFLLASAIGVCLFCASIQVPAFAWLAAAIAYTNVAEKIVLSVATCLMTAGLFCFGFSMNFFHRFRINKRNERRDDIQLNHAHSHRAHTRQY